MAFTLQNDAGDVVDANALVSVAFFSTYHGDRGVDLSPYEQSAIEAAIVKASSYLDARFSFYGEAISELTAWPRTDVYVNGNAVVGIPLAVERAVSEYALINLLGTDLWADPLVDASGRILEETEVSAGPVSERIKYAVGSTSGALRPSPPRFPVADAIIYRAKLVFSPSNLIRA